ncbi:MAG: glycosyltransferase [Sulfurospirillum sp.]|nr:glycosyltransferase [Sulfurospirillum sp.]
MVKVANIVFNPFVNDSRVLKESISLAKNHYKVEVIAHGDKDLLEVEEKENFKIVRFNYLDRKVTKSKKDKLKIYLLWAKEVISYVKTFDILHCNDLNALPIAFIIKKFFNKNIKIVYDAHEYETETNGLSGLQKTLTKKLEKFLIKYADSVICVSNSIADEYVKLYNISKPALVLNTPPLYRNIIKQDIFRDTFNISKEKNIFLYQGGLGPSRGIEVLLDTFKSINNNKSVIVFMGYGTLETLIKDTAKEYKNIYFHKAVAPDVLLNYTSCADFGIATIENTCLSYKYCLPNKVFEYLMAELPVIVSNLYEMKRLVKNNNIGIVATDNTPYGLKDAIQKAILLDKNELNKNIKKVKNIYNWEEQEKVLLELYGELKCVE